MPEGSCTCLMGRNAVGKTTLLRSIMGALKVKSGKIDFDGKDLASAPAEARARRGIGFVPQGREIFGQMSVAENLEIGVVAHGRRKPVPSRIFELFPVLKQMLHRRGGDLSGGQQQQLAIAVHSQSGRAFDFGRAVEASSRTSSPSRDVIMRRTAKRAYRAALGEQKLAFARRVASHFFFFFRGRAMATGEMSALSDDLIAKHLAV